MIVALVAAAHAALPDPLPRNAEGIPLLVNERVQPDDAALSGLDAEARESAVCRWLDNATMPPRSSEGAATFGANVLFDASLSALRASGGHVRRECRVFTPEGGRNRRRRPIRAATFGANVLIAANLSAPCGSGGHLRGEWPVFTLKVADIDVAAPTERPHSGQTFCSTPMCPRARGRSQ